MINTKWINRIAVTAFALLSGLVSPCLAQTAKPTAQDGGGIPVRVEVSRPIKRPLIRTLNLPATLLAGESAELYAKASGYVSTVAVDIGSYVKTGDALLVIDVPEMADELRHAQAVFAAKRARVSALRAQVTQAESRVVTAKADLKQSNAEFRLRKLTRDRMIALWNEKAIPDQKHDEALSHFEVAEAILDIGQAKVQSAEAELQATRADVAVGESQVAVEEAHVGRIETLMKYATLTAPFDGVITARLVDPGAFVRSAAEGVTVPLLAIANVSYIRLALEIPEADVPFVRIGTAVTVDVKAIGGKPINASVTRTAVALKSDTRTMRAEVDLQNSAGRLAPGMYAQVAVTLSAKQNALLIPSKAILVSKGKHTVLVADGQVAKSTNVTLGYDDGIWVEVLSGLSGEEQIILSAGGSVVAGSRIEAVDLDNS